MNYEDQLQHYGIPGMRWGVRKRKSTILKRRKSSSTRQSNTRSTTQNNGTQRRMSNRELTARVKRLRLEKEYASLTQVAKPATVSKIDRLVKTADNVSKLTSSAATIYKNLEQFGVVSKNKRSGS